MAALAKRLLLAVEPNIDNVIFKNWLLKIELKKFNAAFTYSLPLTLVNSLLLLIFNPNLNTSGELFGYLAGLFLNFSVAICFSNLNLGYTAIYGL